MPQRGQTERQATRALTRHQALAIELREIHARRPNWQVRQESRFPYHQLVASGIVDRKEWAKVVQELLDIEAAPLTEGGRTRVHGAKTRFAEKTGLKTARTVDTWLHGDVEVKEASVKQVAEGYGIKPMELLIRVGFYTAEEVPVRLTDKQIDEEQRAVLDLDLDDEQKALILEALDEMRSADEQLLEQQRARDKQRRRQRIAEMIERARERRTA